jgi:drug/metabolite transporter (DMT)-like permease
LREPLGIAAALSSSATWAYASARYALASREVSPVRVNLVRVAVALPLFFAAGAATGGLGGLSPRGLGLLTISTLCSYAFADSLFFAAARRIGVASALAIASSYPLWAALKGAAFDGEPFGIGRALGTVLCVGSVAALIHLGRRQEDARADAPRDRLGFPLAIVTSFLWAGNTIAIKSGSVGLSLYAVNSVRYGIALVLLSGMVLAGRAPGPRRPARGWWPMVPAIILDCVIGSTFFIYGLSHTDLAVGATLSSLAPLLSLPFALWLGVEKLSVPKLIAVVTAVAGIALLSS